MNIELDEAGFCDGIMDDTLEVNLALGVNSLPARKADQLHSNHRTLPVTENQRSLHSNMTVI